ncbi:MAG TPA: hypothetical protein VND62_05180 [Acidimicrobiales bacterium]|nr:hypothetical protein [Acidimicrobiales bacterium]
MEPLADRHGVRLTVSWAFMVPLLVFAGLFAGCDGAPRTAPSSQTGTSTVRALRLTGLGDILVDGRGDALYAYVPDHKSSSRCYGECASVWPPLVLPSAVDAPSGGRGLATSLLGTIVRRDGARQVTYDGWPLYRYRRDHRPGEVTGQGDTMGLWYVVGVSGFLDREPAPDS